MNLFLPSRKPAVLQRRGPPPSLPASSQPSSRDDVFTTFAGGSVERVSSTALRSFFVTSARRVFLFGTIAVAAGGYFRNNDRTHTRPRQTRARREDRRDGVTNRTIIIAFTPSFCRDALCNLSQIIALDIRSVTFQAGLSPDQNLLFPVVGGLDYRIPVINFTQSLA